VAHEHVRLVDTPVAPSVGLKRTGGGGAVATVVNLQAEDHSPARINVSDLTFQ
jgi:hypothetical protein